MNPERNNKETCLSVDTDENQQRRRHSIQAILKDETRTPLERRRSIQLIMDGRTLSMDSATVGSEAETGTTETTTTTHDPMLQEGGAIRTTAQTVEQSRPPCTHYKRNCSIVSPCCGRVFGCRLCHDETLEMSIQPMSVDCTNPEGATTAGTWSTDHKIDRFAIQEVICRLCFTRQSSKTNQCVYCHVRFGEFHCSICNLWMSEEHHPFHCIYCGFCRIRGQNKAPYQHCHQCGMCILQEAIQDHNCQKEKYKTNCPICFEDLFSSRTAVHEMNCGHSIHWACFQKLMFNTTNMPDSTISRNFLREYASRCPLCKKSADPREEMRPTWDALAFAIRLQPVPSEYVKVVTIFCNDCEKKGIHRPWHFLGVQCIDCLSFNTSIVETELSGEAAVAFLRGSESHENP